MYKSVILTQFGGPEVLQVVEKEIPSPAAGECLVKVLAAGVARVDKMMRSGLYPVFTPSLPFCLGKDIAGIVEQAGDGVVNPKPGQTVTAYTNGNAYAEYILLKEEDLIPYPSELDAAEVVCLPLNYVTAYQMMHRFANVVKGERALIHGAGSGVGTALIQLGRLSGLEMYGTASPAKHELVSSLGAKPIDYKSDDFVSVIRNFTGDGVDVVFDQIGGKHIWRSFQTLRANGRLIVYGEQSYASGDKTNKTEEKWHNFLLKSLNFWPSKTVLFYELDQAGEMVPPEWARQDLKELIQLLMEGKIAPVIMERIPLVDAARAHDMLDRGLVAGKLVLICND